MFDFGQNTCGNKFLFNRPRVSGGGDSNYGSVVYLAGFENGSDGSTTFIDEAKGKSCSTNGNAQIDTGQFKFGTASALFDGSGDWIGVGSAGDTDFDFTDGAFTIELFVRFAGGGTEQGLLDIRGTQDTISIGRLLGSLYFRWVDGGGSTRDATYSWSPTNGIWYHICCEREASGGKSRLYIDGVMRGSQTNSNAIRTVADAQLRIGRWDSFYVNGNIDEIRITKGIARYASDAGFAVPAAAYPRS
jgi:hypothetical protein